MCVYLGHGYLSLGMCWVRVCGMRTRQGLGFFRTGFGWGGAVVPDLDETPWEDGTLQCHTGVNRPSWDHVALQPRTHTPPGADFAGCSPTGARFIF